jgi:hypothetical protein
MLGRPSVVNPDHGPDHKRATTSGNDGPREVTIDRQSPFERIPEGSLGHHRTPQR